MYHMTKTERILLVYLSFPRICGTGPAATTPLSIVSEVAWNFHDNTLEIGTQKRASAQLTADITNVRLSI